MACASAAKGAIGLSDSPVDDGIHQDLDWVAVCQKVDNVKSMPDYSHLEIRYNYRSASDNQIKQQTVYSTQRRTNAKPYRKHFLAIVASVLHK